MFPAGDGKWEPYKVRRVNKPKKSTGGQNGDGDVTMGDADTKEEDEESEYEEDLTSDDGAVYPLKGKHPSLDSPSLTRIRANIYD